MMMKNEKYRKMQRKCLVIDGWIIGSVRPSAAQTFSWVLTTSNYHQNFALCRLLVICCSKFQTPISWPVHFQSCYSIAQMFGNRWLNYWQCETFCCTNVFMGANHKQLPPEFCTVQIAGDMLFQISNTNQLACTLPIMLFHRTPTKFRAMRHGINGQMNMNKWAGNG